MKRAVMALLVATSALFAESACSMTLQTQGDTVFATGAVDDDFLKFKNALDGPGVTRVVFVNSPGGDLWTGIHVGQMIASKKLNTVIAGYCASACSIMFMGGVERTFSDAFSPQETLIGIHGPHGKDGQVNSNATPQIYAFYKMQMGDRFNSTVMNKALYSMGNAGALLRVYDPQRELKRNTFHCRSDDAPRKDCEDYKDQDAMTLGIVTSPRLTKLDLPEGYKAIPNIAGRRLTQVLLDPDKYYQEMTEQKCASDHCRKLIPEFTLSPGHKAIAFPITGPGVGTAFNRLTTTEAFVGALYSCNHVKDKPIRLCETQVVDGYDLRGEYIKDRAGTANALARLDIPSQHDYGGEESSTVPNAVEVGRVPNVNAVTPLEVSGIKTYATQDLVREVKGTTPPVIVDVWGGLSSLPGAQPILSGGRAYNDPAKEAVYETKFNALLRLLAPDLSVPLVFVTKNRDSWQAINAALLAMKLGYSQVGWYRGGLDSWAAAKLPLAASVFQAIVEL